MTLRLGLDLRQAVVAAISKASTLLGESSLTLPVPMMAIVGAQSSGKDDRRLFHLETPHWPYGRPHCYAASSYSHHLPPPWNLTWSWMVTIFQMEALPGGVSSTEPDDAPLKGRTLGFNLWSRPDVASLVVYEWQV